MDKRTKVGSVVGLGIVAFVGLILLLHLLKGKPAETEQQNQLTSGGEFYQPPQESPSPSKTAEPLSAVVPPNFLQDKQTTLPSSSQVSPVASALPGHAALPSPAAGIEQPPKSSFVLEANPQDGKSGPVDAAPSAPVSSAVSQQGIPPIPGSTAAQPVGGDILAQIPAPEPVLYMVQQGDTLYGIAGRHYGPEKAHLYKRIFEANRDKLPDENLLKPGDKLLIPFLETRQRTVTSTTTIQDQTYTVKTGDTLSDISLRKLGTANRWREIMTLNGLSSEYSLQVGMVLKLPPVSKQSQQPPPRVPQTSVGEGW